MVAIVGDAVLGLPWWFSGSFHASTEGGTGLIPGGGTKIPHAVLCSQKQNKTQQNCTEYWKLAKRVDRFQVLPQTDTKRELCEEVIC